MQPYCVNSLLSKLVALTHERDGAALEVALIKTLSDFIVSIHGHQAKSVIIYRLKDMKRQLLSVISADENKADVIISEALKQSIVHCFKSGEIATHQHTDTLSIKLYPLKNAAGQIASVISIEAQLTDMHLDTAIGMLLQIYQNFTALINDNECDTLTGLLNRKTFDSKINKTLAKMQNHAKRQEDKSNQVHFLAIFDIDHFKKVNDVFGHLIGDEVLLMFAQLMRQSFREHDALFRFGGEEFVGIFECNSADDIKTILERFKEKVAHFKFPQVGTVTISTGYTEISAFDASSQIIDRADTALYYAKNNGRNRIGYYEQLITDGALEDSKKEGEIELF